MAARAIDRVAKMPSSPKKTILVTGASTGTGLALSKRLVKMDAYRLVLTARESSLKRFEEHSVFEAEHVWLRALDVTSEP